MQDVATSPEGGLELHSVINQSVVRLSQTRRRTAAQKTSPINSEATHQRKSGGSRVTPDDLRVMARRSIPARPKDAETVAPSLCHQASIFWMQNVSNKIKRAYRRALEGMSSKSRACMSRSPSFHIFLPLFYWCDMSTLRIEVNFWSSPYIVFVCLSLTISEHRCRIEESRCLR